MRDDVCSLNVFDVRLTDSLNHSLAFPLTPTLTFTLTHFLLHSLTQSLSFPLTLTISIIQAVALYSPHSEIIDHQPMNIMTKQDYQFSEEFKEKSIYRRIMEDWSKDDGLLTKTYVDRSEKYRAPDSLVGLWKEMIVGYQNELINEKVRDRKSVV